MMKKFVALITVLSLCLMLLPVSGYCDRINWHGTDRTRQLGRQLPYDLKYTGSGRGGVSQICSQVSPLTSINLAFALIQLTHGSPGLHCLANGDIGQEITIELLADPAYIIGDVPMVRTGWNTITFNDIRDRITLTWLDDTYGWIIVNNDGCTITY